MCMCTCTVSRMSNDIIESVEEEKTEQEKMKADFISWANLALEDGDYDLMIEHMRSAVKVGLALSNEERNLFSVAYKNVGNVRYKNWSKCAKGYVGNEKIQNVHIEQLASKLRVLCDDVLELLDKYLLPKADDSESKIFYLKMKGDYSKFSADATSGDTRNAVVEQSQKAYQGALDIAKEKMYPTHPIRLGLAMNFSKFYYVVVNNPERARQLLKEELDDATASHIYSAQMMQVLRRHLSEWSAAAGVAMAVSSDTSVGGYPPTKRTKKTESDIVSKAYDETFDGCFL